VVAPLERDQHPQEIKMSMISKLKDEVLHCHEQDLMDFEKFKDSDVPAALISHPSVNSFFVICADGTVSLLDGIFFDPDFDDLVIDADHILMHALAIPEKHDLLINLEAPTDYRPAAPSFVPSEDWFLGGITAAARKAFGADSHASLEQIASQIETQASDLNPIIKAIDLYNGTLEDPLFTPEENKSWTAAEEAQLGDLLPDILASDAEFCGGLVELKVGDDSGGDAELTIDQLYASVSLKMRATHLLAALLDTQFLGDRWEYNDGPANRASGYYPDGISIFCEPLKAPSNHERLAAQRRLAQRLMARGLSAEATSQLITPVPEFDHA
jgi:hypothetical protein